MVSVELDWPSQPLHGYAPRYVSNLPAMLDARLWRDGTADCEIWVGHRHGF
ncbi:hypothetical protein TIFTF001_027804 [Ficus carica]|uniref:Uncharacterized protein n=1 Tax=Ficus carica TaxID=3494 RepID=A0AA88J0R5_FICCA|nr:hypothetical protein TIFTF001_027804 [Ficus carica]